MPTIFLGVDPSIEHNYNLPSQKELKRRLDKANDVIIADKKKIKVLKNYKRRKIHTISSLTEIIQELKNKIFLSESASEKLNELGSKVPVELFKRLIEDSDHGTLSRKEYSEELKSFSLTLQFYSGKGYNYVRERFLKSLPHENTIHRWYSTVQAATGVKQKYI